MKGENIPGLERSQFASLVELAGWDMVETDPSGRITYVSKAFLRKTGYCNSDLVGRMVSEALGLDVPMEGSPLIGKCVLGGAQGKKVHYHYKISPVSWDSAERNLILFFQSGEPQDRFTGAAASSLSPERSTSFFHRKNAHILARLSHSIRNPMNSVMGFAEILAEGDLSVDERQDYVAVIHSSGRMLLDLIDTLLELARLESGEILIHRSLERISELVRQVALHFSEGFQGHRPVWVQTVCDLSADLDQGLIDGDLLKKILIALINHIRYHSGSDRITLECRIILSKLLCFELIWRPDILRSESEQEAVESPEMELASGLVSLFSGEIRKSDLGSRGQMISVEIPFVRSGLVKGDDPVDSESKKGSWRGKRILIIEDDDISFQYLNAALRTTGVTVFRADNGARGVHFVEENPDLDLVLLDIRMPEMNGFEAAVKILAIRRDLPLIAQTAYAFPEDFDKCLSVGCADVLTKPIRREQLFSVLTRWLG